MNIDPTDPGAGGFVLPGDNGPLLIDPGNTGPGL